MKVNKEVNITTSLKKGDKINVYTDWQDEHGFEGRAVLIKKVKDGDSYYLDGEELKPKDSKEYNEKAIAEIVKYNRLIYFFKGKEDKKPSIYCRRLYRDLLKARKDELVDFVNMKKVISKYRKKHTSSIKRIGSLLNEYDDYYLIRFVQQDRDTWKPSIFSFERWNVRMISDDTGWSQDWTTQRNIRILKCYNPTETQRGAQLVEYTTYCGLDSRTFDRIVHKDKYLARIRHAQAKQNESVFIDDDEMDDFIESKIT